MALEERSSLEEILRRLKGLEERIGRIEEHLSLPGVNKDVAQEQVSSAEEREDALELQIGQNWFAKAGIVGIAVGIAFLLTFPYQDIPPFGPSMAGYVLAGALMALSHIWRKAYDQISRYLLGGGMLLLYFTTLRLSRFSPQPALANELLESILLTAVVLIILAVAFRRVSPYLTALGLFLGALALARLACVYDHPDRVGASP